MKFNIPQEILDGPRNLFPGFWLRHIEASDTVQCERRVVAREASPTEDRVVLRNSSPHTVCIIKFSTNQRHYGRYFGWMKHGFDKNFQPKVLLLRPYSIDSTPDLDIVYLEFDDAWKSKAGTPYRNQHQVFHDRWLTLDARTDPRICRTFTADLKTGLDINVDFALKFQLSIKLCPDLDPATTATSSSRKV